MLKDELLQVDGIVNYRSELVKKLQIEPVVILFGAGIRGQYTYPGMAI